MHAAVMSTMLWADAQQGECFDKRIGKVIIGVFSPPVGPALVMMIKKIFATDVRWSNHAVSGAFTAPNNIAGTGANENEAGIYCVCLNESHKELKGRNI